MGEDVMICRGGSGGPSREWGREFEFGDLRFQNGKIVETVETVQVSCGDRHTLLKDQAGLAKGVNETKRGFHDL
jgi:hypothetical protein